MHGFNAPLAIVFDEDGNIVAMAQREFRQHDPRPGWVEHDAMEILESQLATAREDDRVIRVSSTRKLGDYGWSVFARKGFLSEWRKGRQVASIDLRAVTGLPGAHNHQNACAAYAAVRALGLAPREIEAAFHSFAGLPHRSQTIAEIGGVRWVNDSKATNVDSAAKALAAFDNIRWIAGGLGKEGGVTALARHLGKVRKAYFIGHSARDFALDLDGLDHEICETMEAAVAACAREAEAGDTVLLAPAAASFDQYPNFEKRGEHFTALVAALGG